MRKVCKHCKIFVAGDVCPICGKSDFTTNWQGRIAVIDPVKSEVAKKIGITRKGDYALKIR